jgi:hypothetical protein
MQLQSVTRFTTEDIGAVLEWLAMKRWYSVADLKDGYWRRSQGT